MKTVKDNKESDEWNEAVKVLVVDDEYRLTKRLYDLYFCNKNERNLEFSFAGNGKSALIKISEIPFKVIITDIMMPEMDGIELLRRIKCSGKKMVTIVVTACSVEEYWKEEVWQEVFKTFSKPRDFELLVVAIR